METLGLSNPKLNCQIRKISVPSTPEEKLRQALIRMMLDKLAYPIDRMVVEKHLKELPHLSYQAGIPDRRLDILCYGFFQNTLTPLLLIECKAEPLTVKVEQQVIGYNQFVKARFIACANPTHIKTGWYDPQLNDYRWMEGLPDYQAISS